jgi:hypothetical protein
LCVLQPHPTPQAFGAYGSFGGGKTYYGSASLEKLTDSYAQQIDTPNMTSGGGLVIDTNCAGVKLFNYRFMAGYDVLFSKRPGVGKMGRVNLINTFGFGIFRSELVRLWLGPQLGIFYLSGRNSYPATMYYISSCYELEQSMMGVGLGMTLGINFNPGEYVTISLEGGMRYTVYYGIQSEKQFIYSYYIPLLSFTNNHWAPSSGYEGYGCLSVMYRVRDRDHNMPDRAGVQ